MKKFWKGALVCGMMALLTPFLVGCDSTPAWQKVDYINTNASYDNDVGYNDLNDPLTEKGINQLSVMSGKIKIASEIYSKEYSMILAGVVDPSTEGEDDDVKAAVRMNLSMTFFNVTMSTEIIFYITKDMTYYLNMSVNGAGESQNIKIKASAEDLAPMFEDPSMQYSSPTELLDQLKDINTIENIIDLFEIQQTDLDKFIYGIATDETTGITKYIMTLKNGETITESVEMMGQQVQGTVKNGVAYIAVKDNVIIEVYGNSIAEVNDTNIRVTTSIKEYNNEMPKHGEGYLTMAEYMAQFPVVGDA